MLNRGRLQLEMYVLGNINRFGRIGLAVVLQMRIGGYRRAR